MRRILVLTALWLAAFSPILAHAQSSNTPSSRTTPTLTDGWVVVTGSHTLVGLNAVIDTAVGGYILVYDSVTIPSDGPVQPAGCFVVNPKGLAPASETSMANTPLPIAAVNGLVLVYSDTGCLLQTKHAIMWANTLFQ